MQNFKKKVVINKKNLQWNEMEFKGLLILTQQNMILTVLIFQCKETVKEIIWQLM